MGCITYTRVRLCYDVTDGCGLLFSVSGVSRLQPKARTAQFCLLVHGGHWGLGPAAKGVGLARQLNKTLGAIPSLFFAAQDAGALDAAI